MGWGVPAASSAVPFPPQPPARCLESRHAHDLSQRTEEPTFLSGKQRIATPQLLMPGVPLLTRATITVPTLQGSHGTPVSHPQIMSNPW